MELLRFEQIWALRHLLEELGEKEASFPKEFSLLVAEALLLGKSWNIEAREAFDEAISEC